MSGIVVDHKEAQVRYAISEENFNPETMERVRDLRPEETVLGYRPKPIGKGSDGNVTLDGLEQPSPEQLALDSAGGGTDHATSNAEAPKPGPKTEEAPSGVAKGNAK